VGFLLQHLLTESANRRPDATAIRMPNETMTYGELERQSNQLAHALVEAGVRRGDRVGLHLRKSTSAIIGIFGTLKAGGIYVPMDANAPGSRIADIVEQTRATHLLTSATGWEKVAPSLENGKGLRSIFYADQRSTTHQPIGAKSFTFAETLPNHKSENPGRDGSDQDLAYILCTSGSTGKPKGVMLSHLNALTFVNWGCDTFQITPEDRLSNHAPFIFDLSVFDIYCGIKAGAAISLIPEGTATIPSQLSKMIEEHRLTVWYSVPSVLTLLLLHGALAERDLSQLRLILYAGEVFPVKFLRSLMEVLPGPRYFNLYGPTETNVITYYEIKPPIPAETKSIPIGKACENSSLIAVDENGEAVTEPGREGLLYAWGSTVTRGYFGRPVETEKAFFTNPFVEGRDEKLYATGDWVSLDEDGNYVFIGRKDHQIKTRGYRVELGDIEAVLYANPAIREAVVIPIPDDLLGNTIKAVIVPVAPDTLTEQDVKRHVASSLPRYMVPETVEFRTSLPRTATDKVDRPRLVAESVNGKK
jgi:amino acid adenylation domain-containing protein